MVLSHSNKIRGARQFVGRLLAGTALVGVAAVVGPRFASAADVTWTGAAGPNFAALGNYNPGALGPVGNHVIFNGGGGGNEPFVLSNASAGSITLSGNTLTVSTGMALTVDGGFTMNGGTLTGAGAVSAETFVYNGGTLGIANLNASTATFNSVAGGGASVNLDAGTLAIGTLDINGTGNAVDRYSLSNGTLVMNSIGGAAINVVSSQLNGNDLASDLTLRLDSDTLITTDTNSQYVINGAITGAGQLQIVGAGQVILGNNPAAHPNIYSGGTLIQPGATLVVGLGDGSGSLGGGAITNSGTLIFNTGAASIISSGMAMSGAGVFRVDGASTLRAGAGDVFSGAGQYRLFAANSVLDLADHNEAIGSLNGAGGSIVSLGTGTLTVGGNDVTSNFFGTITGGGGLTKIGDADMTVASATTYTGPTTVQDGFLTIGGTTTSTSFSASQTGHLWIFSANLVPTTSSFTASDTGVLEFNASNQIGSLNGTSDTQLMMLAGSTLTVGTDAADGTFSGTMGADGNGSLAKIGTGTLMLSGNNGYTGGTTIDGGTLRVGSSRALGTGSVNLASGELDLNGQSLSIGSLSGTAGSIGSSASGASTLIVNQTTDGVLPGGIIENVGTIALVKNGAAALTLTNFNSYSGGTTINAGKLVADAGGALGPDTSSLTVNGGILDVIGRSFTVGSLSGTGGAITNSAVAANTLAVNQASDTAFAGVIEDGAGQTEMTKSGVGKLTLNGANTYTGSTTVSSGTLIVGDDAHSGASIAGAVQVDAGGTLGGSGTIGGAAIIDGTLSAGNSPGMLSFAGDLTLNAGSTSVFELNTPGVVGGSDPATGNDLVEVGGMLALGGELQAHVASAGFYRLFDYGTLAAGNTFDTETVSSSRGGFDVASYGVDTSVVGQVNLSVLGTGQTMQFWDGADTTGNGIVDGGNGTWASFGANWTDTAGAANDGWGGSVGVFMGGTAGVVAVDGVQSFDTLQFKTDGYDVHNGTLAFAPAAGTTATISVDDAVTASIGSILADGTTGTGLAKLGEGTLILSGTNTYTGGTELLDGTLSVSDDSNLGAVAGDLTFDGGVLETTADLDSARIVTLSGNGGFDSVGGTILRLSGAVSGAGYLVKAGEGTLVLTGDNAYGGTIVAEGTLVGDIDSISGDIANAGSVIFDQAADGSFAGDIGGLNDSNGALVKRGIGSLALTGTSALDWTIEAGDLLTNAARFTGNSSIASAASLSFADAGNASYAGSLSGSGAFTKAGSGELLYTGDSSAFAGTTTVAAGALIVGDSADAGDAMLGGDIDVLDGALLGGHGTVGSTGSMVTIGAGASLAPGHSIGTLNVAGDLSFAVGSELTVEADPTGTDADLVAVAGHVSIDGGTVVHVGPDGGFRQQASYTILTAGNGIDGSFDAVTSNFAFLDAALDQCADAIDLILSRNDTGFDNPAETRNQKAVAGAIAQMHAGNPVYDAILGLPDDNDVVRASFDALSGEVHASAGTVFIEDSAILRNAINDRLRSAFDDVGAGAVPVLSYAGDVPQVTPADPQRFALWGQAFGAWGHSDGNGNAEDIDTSTGGFIMGGDALAGDWRLGLLASYGHTSFDIDERNASASSQDYTLGLYGGTQWGNVAFRSGLAYTWHDIGTSRSVTMPGLTDSFAADYRAATAQAFAELGYRIDMGSATFEPFANLAYVHLDREGFSEEGGPGALSASEENAGTPFTTLGLRATSRFSMGTTIASVHAMIGWRHAMGDIDPDASLAFAGSPDFTIAGAPLARDTALVEAGIDLNLSDTATLGFSYSGQFAANAHNDNLTATLQVKF